MDLSHEFRERTTPDIEKIAREEKEKEESDARSGRLDQVETWGELHYIREHEIKINEGRITIPDWLEINDWERNVLEILRERLRIPSDVNSTWSEPRGRESDATAVSSDEAKAKPWI